MTLQEIFYILGTIYFFIAGLWGIFVFIFSIALINKAKQVKQKADRLAKTAINTKTSFKYLVFKFIWDRIKDK